MTNKQNVAKPKNPPINFVYKGMELGSKAGFRLSMLYAISGIFLVFLIEAFGDGVGFLDWREIGIFDCYRLIRATPLFFIAAFVILFVAIGPATILGILTGMLLGKFVEIFIGRISKYFLVFSCALLCIIIAILIHLFFDIPVVFSFQQPPTTQSHYFSMGIYETYRFTGNSNQCVCFGRWMDRLATLFEITYPHGRAELIPENCPTQRPGSAPGLCTRLVGVFAGAIFKHFSGFEFFLLPSRGHSRPPANNASR